MKEGALREGFESSELGCRNSSSGGVASCSKVRREETSICGNTHPSLPLPARRSPTLTKILFAAVAQPDPENLRHFLLFGISQGLVKCEGLLPLAAAGPIVMRILLTAGRTNAPADFFG